MFQTFLPLFEKVFNRFFVFAILDLHINSYQKIECLCTNFGMSQIILNPRHFTETSQSLIDIFLVTNPDNVVDCGVGEPFLDQLVRYQCPIYCILDFDRPIAFKYKRKVWILINLPRNLKPPITAQTFGKQCSSSPLYPRHLMTYRPFI